jgi:hypothetical protein
MRLRGGSPTLVRLLRRDPERCNPRATVRANTRARDDAKRGNGYAYSNTAISVAQPRNPSLAALVTLRGGPQAQHQGRSVRQCGLVD